MAVARGLMSALYRPQNTTGVLRGLGAAIYQPDNVIAVVRGFRPAINCLKHLRGAICGTRSGTKLGLPHTGSETQWPWRAVLYTQSVLLATKNYENIASWWGEIAPTED